MSATPFFISDLHISHKNILHFSPERQGPTIEDHDRWIVTQWNSVVKPKDIVYVLGDVVFDKLKLPLLSQLRGNKILIRGNHDKFDTLEYLQYFSAVHGMIKYKEFWLTHSPIHPQELRGKVNVHGHVHNQSIPDDRYVNVCVEALNGTPLSLDQLRDLVKSRNIPPAPANTIDL